jgi:hypothetical protein
MLAESTIINQLRLTPEDSITIVSEQAGSAPYSHKTRLEFDIMSGISEADLVNQEGSLAALENCLLKYFRATTLEEARANIMKEFLLDL